jgi:hypothetical protein
MEQEMACCVPAALHTSYPSAQIEKLWCFVGPRYPVSSSLVAPKDFTLWNLGLLMLRTEQQSQQGELSTALLLGWLLLEFDLLHGNYW